MLQFFLGSTPPAATGAATLGGTGGLSATGVAESFGSASLAGVGGLAASGANAHAGSATLAGSGSLSATGVGESFGSASLAASGALAASGIYTSVGGGSAALAGHGGLSAAGFAETFGSAALAGSGALSATGTARYAAAATLAGLGSLSASGTAPYQLGSAALAALGSLATSGAFAPAKYRDRDAFYGTVRGSGIIQILEALGEFDEVIFARSPDRSRATSDQGTVAVLTPGRVASANDGSPDEWLRSVNYTLTIEHEADEEEDAYGELDRLLAVALNALLDPAARAYGGFCLGWRSRLALDDFQTAKNPSRRRVLNGQFTYRTPSSTGLSTAN